MIDLGQFGRLLRITRIFVKHDLDEFVRTIHLFRPYRLMLRLLPWRWGRPVAAPRGQRLREALEELGPVFVKFGQVLSTRPDLLPEDIATELAKLQDQVPPFAGEQAIAIIETALGGKVSNFFSEFSSTPLASASVAQVHVAKLHDGKEVVVKVLRPGIEPVIERDLALLYTLARLAVRYWSEGQRLRPVEVVDQFRKTLHDELDLRVEAGNASQLRANFAASPLLYVPQVYWDLVRREVMVMERIHGIPVSDIEGLRRAGIDLRTLSHHGVEIFFTQAFRDGFFHADMHPGNIFVYPDGRYCAVDFGIMGTLSDKDKRYLAENFLAFFNRDYRGVAEAHLRSGWVPAGTRAEEFETAIRAVCEPIFAKPIKDISFGRFLLQLFQTARRFRMEIQPQLVLLQKTLFNIEGLGRRLYPDLDLWDTAKPYLERWMREQLGPRAFLRTLRREAPKWWELMPQLPVLVHETLRRATAGNLSLEWRSQELEALARQMRRNYRRLYFAIAGGALLISAILLIGTGAGGPFDSWRDGAGWAAGVIGLWMLWRTWPGREAG
ncbi:MAG: ubiquinone biosynthesis protein UbiB [Acidithiobacillales bacterium SM1_46]|jgi:ubiquinone biosynthesis protein|nr:MAG: ubiquinone biosynthesis protein UbiB [Acidithiobacillales bacterium SM1_46]